ncbi:MAG TPA: hypothetical protein VN999_14245 [Thermoanaerobaculia bacterium]|nr:hypothetical protein [Thermoanaerobaculia bacterium]
MMTTHRQPTPHRDPDPNLPAAGREGGAAAPATLRTSRLSLARSGHELRRPAITAG